MNIEPLLYYIFLLSGELLAILAVLHMIATRRSPSSMIAWILAILFFPYIAVPFYFLFGHRKLIKRYQKLKFLLRPLKSQNSNNLEPVEKVLLSNSIPLLTVNNSFKLIDSPLEIFSSIKEAINSATKSIDICVYQCSIDETTKELLYLLRQKARDGIKVRLLLDSIGSFGLYLFQAPLKDARKDGVEIYFFMPFLRAPFRNFINLRNHRRIFIFDNFEMFTGGVNLSGKYFSKDESKVYYRDFICRIEGEATHFYSQIFEMDWAFASNKKPKITAPSDAKFSNAALQVVPSGPDTPNDALIEAFLTLIYEAKKEIYIVTPYFIPNDEFIEALTIAMHRGVKLTIIVPKRSDHKISDLGRGSYLRYLAQKGAKVLLHTDKVLHAKAILFDDRYASVGSVSFDNRSLYYNFEAVSIIYSKQEIDMIKMWIKKSMLHTEPYKAPTSAFTIHAENFMRVISPLA